jgi:Ni/Fe-hydrogenase subunit HybB-like protein
MAGFVASVGAVVLGVVSVVAVKWYVFDIAIGQTGDADRSMLFWGLPIVFLGLIAGAGAFGLAVVAWKVLTQRQRFPRT